MSDCLVSIIVAIFNAEKYLSRCLKSLANQTYKNLDIILVDDGSTDNSGILCDAFASRDARFRVIHKTNGGVSSARQTGLNSARGEYVIHADPDDWVEKEWIESLIKHILEKNVDIAMCDYFIEQQSGTFIKQTTPTSLMREDLLCDLLIGRIWGSLWNKLIKKTCFEQYRISFVPNMSLWEDSYVITKLIYEGASFSYLHLPLYHYDCSSNENSIVRNPDLCHIYSMKIYIDDFEKVLKNKKYEEGFYYKKFLLKRRCFRTGKMNKDVFISLFPEFNNRFIEENPFRWRDLRSYRGDILRMEKICMAMVLKRKSNFGYDFFQFWNRFATKSLRSYFF